MNLKKMIGIYLICMFLLTACAAAQVVNKQTVKIAYEPTVGPSNSNNLSPTPEIVVNNNGNNQSFRVLNLNATPVNYSFPLKQLTDTGDVLREVSWSGGMGGWGCESINLQKGQLKFLDDNPVEEIEWMESSSTASCGWLPGETVSYSLTPPLGNTISGELKAENNGLGDISFPNSYNTQPGKYFIEYKGTSGSLSKTIIVKVPDKPRLYKKDNTLLLYNFSTNEPIRLLVYISNEQMKGTLWDAKGYTTDENGQLIIQIDTKNATHELGYAIIGEKSGEVHVFPSSQDPIWWK